MRISRRWCARARTALWLAAGAQARSLGHSRLDLFGSAHQGWEGYESRSFEPCLLRLLDFSEANPWSCAEKLERIFGTRFSGPVLLVPENKHYSWTKGASLIGLGSEALWPIALDTHGRLCLRSLEELIERAQGEHRPILMVVSVAGSTELGTFDPIDQVQDLLDSWREKKGIHIWHHIDGAFGGFFAAMGAAQRAFLGAEASAALNALARADSITLDPHKLGYVPYSCGSFLARDRRDYFVKGFSAPYVQFDSTRDRGPFTLEGSRSAAGAVATWMISRTVGLDENGYGKILSRTVQTKQLLEDSLRDLSPLIRLAPGTHSNILCFTYAHQGEPLSRTNSRIEALFQSLSTEGTGQFFASMTRLRWPSYGAYLDSFIRNWRAEQDAEELVLLRLCLMNPFFSSKETQVDFRAELLRELWRLLMREEAGSRR